MAEPDAFDPTHALDGWRVPAPAPLDLTLQLRLPPAEVETPVLTGMRLVEVRAEPDAFDPTHVLDGWHPPAPAPLDLDLRALLRTGTTGPDEAKRARLKARGYEMLDVEDIELSEPPPVFAVLEASVLVIAAMPPAAPEPQEAGDSIEQPEPHMEDIRPPEVAFPSAEESAESREMPVPDMQAVPLAEPEPAPPPPVEPIQSEAPAAAVVEVSLPEPHVEDLEPAEVAQPPAEESAESPGMQSPAAVEMPVADMQLAPPVEPEPPPLIEDIPAEIPAPTEPDPQPFIEDVEAPLAMEAAPEMEPPSPEPGPRQDAEDTTQPDTPPPVDEVPVQDVEAAPAQPEPEIDDDVEPSEVPTPAFVEVPVLDFHAPPPPAVVETPVLDFRASPPPELDARRVIEDVELPKVSPPPAVIEAPVLDIAAAARPAGPDPRLLARWQPQAWTALARRVAEASTEVRQTSDGLSVDHHAPQWLCALWAPQRVDAPQLGRWPELAALVDAESRSDALHQMLAELPGDAALWSVELEADWGLVADLVLHQDAGLRPAQARALRELAEAERQASLARLSDGYASQGRVARRRA